MSEMGAMGALAAALAKAQGEIEGASKDKTNPHFKSRYADLASVWDACRKALSANEIAVIQSPSADGPLVTVETVLVHSSGAAASSRLTMKARDDSPQAIGSAITYGRRYGLASMVGVAPEDDDAEAAQGRAVAAPPTVVLDTKTGAEVQAANRPQPPEGFHYIDGYQLSNGWHEIVIANFDAQGGAMKFATKTKEGELAGQAYQMGVPVQIEWKPKPNSRGEAYLNKVRLWKPEPKPVGEPVGADSIPF